MNILRAVLPVLVLILVAPKPGAAATFNGYSLVGIDTYIGNVSFGAVGGDTQNVTYGGSYQTRNAAGLTAYSAHSDFATGTTQAVASIAIYGADTSRTGYINDPGLITEGRGVEPMIDVLLETSPRGAHSATGGGTPIDAVPYAQVSGSASVLHRVALTAALPSSANVANVTNNIPLQLQWRYHFVGSGAIEGNLSILVDSPTGDCAAGVGGLCGGFGASTDDLGFLPENSGSIPFTAVASTAAREAVYEIGLGAYGAIGVASSLQGVIDPFLTVDQSWEYAEYFSVQQESALIQGEWVSINRDYLNTVPVPAAVWLFGSGLIGLVGIARRRKISTG